jgi:hypothetical protein
MIHSYSGTSIEIIDTMLKAVWSSLMVFLSDKKLKPEYIVISTHLPVVVGIGL